MNGAQAITQFFAHKGIDEIFGYPGGCIMPLYDALLDAPVRHILCRHEQAAALAADGYARASGRPGVCIATSGPGATNLVTGVANAYMDSIPLIVISGQVPTALIGTDAFQETDVLGLTLGIVKHSWLIDEADDIPRRLCEAWQLATEGRPGPVWLDIPKDVLLAELSAEAQALALTEGSITAMSCANDEVSDAELIASLSTAARLFQSARKPLLYTGGGIQQADAVSELRELSHQLGLPQVVTLKGIGNAAPDDDLALGMLGMHGSPAANEAVHECDLLIALGVRFDDRATGKLQEFAPNARVIHIDQDAAEFHKNRFADCTLKADLKTVLPRLQRAFGAPTDIETWRTQCRQLKTNRGFLAVPSTDRTGAIEGPDFLARLSRLAPEGTRICCDVGQHQMWVAQYMDFGHPTHHLSSGGLGTMGFGLPAAIGAQLACPEAAVVNITGDGSFLMNVQELATLQRYGLPIKIIILDNQRLGMVRQQQELFYEQRYSEVDLSDNPDFAALAKAFGLHAITIDRCEQVHRAIENLFAYPGAMLMHVRIANEANVWPIVKPGSGNRHMILPTSQSGDAA